MKEIKVFRDPLYGYVKVEEELIWKLIQTKELQRLRRIHQLGGSFVVYHTAEHSRFSHSLGVYEVARRILYEVEAIRVTLTKEERLITECAALLHDIGHGPYSHSFEIAFETNHELNSIKIILDKNTEVHQILEKYKPGFSEKVANVINKKCYKDVCESDLCNHHIMNSIISSQLDADRLDYLQRDAYNSGVSYGEIDLERLLRSFLIVNNKIAFKFTSMHAIEDYLLSRYHMYWQVYYHPVGISYEIILLNIFKRIKELINNQFKFKSDVSIFQKIIKNNISINLYLDLDEPFIISKIKEWRNEEDIILVDLCNRYINRHLFKYLSCYSNEMLDQKFQDLNSIFKKYNINTNFYLHKDTIVKEAYNYYNDETITNGPILLYIDNELVEITEVSHIVKGIMGVGAKTDYKIYYPEEFIKKMNKEDQKIIAKILN